MIQKERRKAQRVEARLSMEVSLETAGVGGKEVETLNVSTNGAYFVLDHFLEPLTKIEVTIVVPGEKTPHSVTCQGIVVRTEPEEPSPDVDSYNVACFFTHIPEKELEILEFYILQNIPI